MELLLKCAAVAASACAAALVVKKYNPESSLAVTIAAGIVLMTAALGALEALRSEVEALGAGLLPDGVGETILKVGLLAVVTKTASELCRDAGESSLGSKLELVGTIAAVSAAMPLFASLLKLAREGF